MLEIEDKFRVHPDFVLPPLAGNGDRVQTVGPAREVTMVATYFDTDDLRLARSGITLRFRTGEKTPSWQLKLPVPGQVGARNEISEPGPPDAVPERLRSLVTARVRHAELQPRATLTTARTIYDLHGHDGQLVAELVDDRVQAQNNGHPVARFRELEVEDYGGGSVVLDEVGSRLRGAGAVHGEFLPKVVRALGERATAPPDPPLPAEVSRRDPARSLVAATLRRHVHQLLDSDAAVRAELDDDGVHQMRVAARRLRSALRDFGPLLDDTWAWPLQDELEWLGRRLSAARDLQVVSTVLADAVHALPAELEPAAAQSQIDRVLAPELAAAAHQVTATLTDPRYIDLLDALVDAATHPRTTDEADRPCRRALPPLVHASRRRLAKRFAAAIDSGDPVSHHRARKAAKHTRYLAEALVQVYGKPAQRFARNVEEIQELLGEHQDAVVAADTLRRIADTARSVRSAFTLGVLHAEQLHRAQRLREHFAEIAPAVARARQQRWVDD